ncbi:MAG: hypothetical protein ACRC1Z_12275 [Waterburya sp.]
MIQLTGGLSFGMLDIYNNDSGTGVIIRDGVQDTTSLIFASVNNIDAANLTQEDFVTV